MINLSEVLESNALAADPCLIPLRPHTLHELENATSVNKIVLLSGPHGTGKTDYVKQAISTVGETGRFARSVGVISELLTGELEVFLIEATREAPLLLGVDKPFALSDKALSLLDEKVRAGACVAIIECTAIYALPEVIKGLARDTRTAEITHTTLAEQETYDTLRAYLDAPVVAESAYLLWYRTRGNQELVKRWATDLRKSGELRFGEFAWYWNGISGPTQSVFDHVMRQFEQLDETQKRFVEHLSLAGSLPRGSVAKLIDDETLTKLRTIGLVEFSNETGLAVTVRLCAQIWGEVLRIVILPGRRHEIFKQLAAPTRDTRDMFAALSWGVAALQDGYSLGDDDLVVATQAAYVLHRWDLLEVFVDLRFPPTAPVDELLAQIEKEDVPTQASRVVLLVLRAQGYLKQSRNEEVGADLEFARAIVDNMAYPIPALYRSITKAEALLLRGQGGNAQQLADLYSREVARARGLGDEDTAERIWLEALALPVSGVNLQDHLETIGRHYENQETTQSSALAVLPEYIYLLGLSGKLTQAMETADRALAHRAFRDVSSAESDYPWVFAEAVSARYMVGVWKGDLASALAVPNYVASVSLIDSAVYQTGMGRSLALLGQWETARDQYLGALERFSITDPIGRIKYAMAGYVQSLAASGSKADTISALRKYDAMPYLSTEILAADCDYLVLTAAYAVGMDDFEDRLIRLIKTARRNGHWFAILKGAHLGVVASGEAKALKYREILGDAMNHVDETIAEAFRADADASLTGTAGEQAAARAELTRLGIWVPSPQVAPKLTKRQRQIAEFVARGMTNREIASRLVLSVRTVDAHVASILMRTGVSDRKELSGRLRDFI